MHFGGWIVVRADSAHGHLRYLASNVLPGGEAVLINIYKSGRDVRLGIVRLADGTVTDLGISGANAEYLHTAHIVFGGLDRSIRAAPFSLRRKRITGPIVAVDEHPTTPGRRRFSPAGTLAYVTRSSRATRLMMVDRRGNTSTFADRVELFSSPRFSPDGRRLAVYAATNPPRRIWVYGLESRTFTPLSGAIPGSVGALGWTPDGQHVAFTSGTLTPGGPLGIRWQVWDGSAPAQAMLPRKIATSALAFGPPHSYMVFQEGGRLNGNLWIAPLDSLERAQPLVNVQAPAYSPGISSSGRLLAYTSEKSGRAEIYVTPLPGPGGHLAVSEGGGTEPVWAGGTLFYRGPKHVFSAVIAEKPQLTVTRRDTLFPDPYVRAGDGEFGSYDIFPDGQHFLMLRAAKVVPARMFVVVNWAEQLRHK